MQIENTEEQYGLAAKAFHWLIAVMILGLIPVGFFMGGMENSPLKLDVFGLHKSFGLLVFFLGIGRIVWRFVSPPPDHLETHARWEVTLAGAAHFWLYVCIIGMPLSGWLMSSAGEFPVPFFGIQMPHIIGKNEALGDTFYEIHEVLAYTLLCVLALHMAGALKHHVLDKDETLERMAFPNKGLLLPVLVVLVAGSSYTVTALALLSGENEDAEEAVVEQEAAGAAAATAAMPDAQALGRNGWAIVPDKSTLGFQAVVYNAPFTGKFGDFSGTIVFDPADLSTARADITIGMKNIATGDKERDDTIVSTEWFDALQFPESRFVASKFEQGDGNHYVAIGDLTIKGKTMPLALPFTLVIKDKTAHMTAEVDINRMHYDVGSGQWADESSVAHDVKLLIDLTASQP